jgi:bifunctional DNA-binding transcriptional regulator/antitoxin component of YhaV-PrlF toxin-antitoxin module
MTIPFKNDKNAPLVVPAAARRRARFKDGQELEFRVSGGLITILPKLPGTDDEYTSVQRSAIDAELKDAENGPFHGPFDTMDEMITDLRRRIGKPKRKRNTSPSR